MKIIKRICLLLLKNKLRRFKRDANWYVKQGCYNNWYHEQGIPNLEKQIQDLENEINNNKKEGR